MSDLPEKVGPVPVDKPWHKLREFLQKKTGPLPNWAWGLLGGGVIAGVWLMRGKMPGMGALSGQNASIPSDAGLGGGAGGDIQPPEPPGPGGGATSPPSGPPQPVLIQGGGQQSGSSGGRVSPGDGIIPDTSIYDYWTAHPELTPTTLEGHPGKQADDLFTLARQAAAGGGAGGGGGGSWGGEPAPTTTSLAGHPGKQADDVIQPAKGAPPIDTSHAKSEKAGYGVSSPGTGMAQLNNTAGQSKPGRRGGPQEL